MFDYFYPGLIPGSALGIPATVISNWLSYEQQIIGAISTNKGATGQLLNVTLVTIADINHDYLMNYFMNYPKSLVETVIGLLSYNVLATNDGKRTLNGQPFANLDRSYAGSDNDTALKLGVQRYEAEPTALAEIQAHYDTSGLLIRPLESMHTTYDPFVPYWHEALYLEKITRNGLASNYLGIPVKRYGHVNFTADEVEKGFGALVDLVKGDR